MLIKNSSPKKLDTKHKRYWYHISNTLKDKKCTLIPWDNAKGFNRNELEPDINRICVSPTIQQCLTAVPYFLSSSYNIYRTKEKVAAHKPIRVFDAKITNEGWLLDTTDFIKIGSIDLNEIESGEKIESVMHEAASRGNVRYSKKVLNWWRRIKLQRYIKKS